MPPRRRRAGCGIRSRAPPRERARGFPRLVVAHDEERQLADCLACLGFADEIVVVLDRCRDRSREIALQLHRAPRRGRLGARGAAAARRDRRLPRRMDPRNRRRRAGRRRSSPPKSARVVRNSSAAWHLIPVDNYIGDAAACAGAGALPSAGRPMPRCSARASNNGAISGCTRRFRCRDSRARRSHRGSSTMSTATSPTCCSRLDRYTTARAQDLRDSGDIGSYGRNLRRIVSRFWKCYVGRRGYREGP